MDHYFLLQNEKHTRNNLIFAIVLTVVVGCNTDKDANPTPMLATGIFTTMDELQTAVEATYQQLYENPWNSGMGSARARAVFLGADDLTTQPRGSKSTFRDPDHLNQQRSISDHVFWLPYANAIVKASQAFTRSSVLLQDSIQNERANSLEADAHFLRGWAYFRAVRIYGPVPILTATDSSWFRDLPRRSSESLIYDQILADLDTAMLHLPADRYDRSKPTVWTAKALRAHVYLTMAGWPMKQTDKYALAMRDAQEVINSGLFSLEPAFAPMFQIENEETNTEYIRQLHFCDEGICRDNGRFSPFASQTTKPAELGGFQDVLIELAFFHKFPEGARKDHTFLTELRYEDGTIQPWQEFGWRHPFLSNFYDGGVDKNATVESQLGSTSLSELDYLMIRYAEILLIYAEAHPMSGGGDAAVALEYLNQIRRRGKGVDINTPDKEDLLNFTRQDVLDERGWEFVGEMKRWFDLIRTETLAEALADRDSKWLPLVGDPNDKNVYQYAFSQWLTENSPELLLEPIQ